MLVKKNRRYYVPEEAIRYAEMACELTDYKKPGILDTLAASYASAGKFQKAVEVSKKALKLAKSSDQKNLVSGIQSRLILYEAGRAYIELPIAIPANRDKGRKNAP